jgi:benzodiazapine receptor
MSVNSKSFQIINVFAVVFTIAMNMLANILPFNGVTTGAVSDSFPNYFTPQGYVFAIWGIIYVLLIVFAFYQAKADQRDEAYLRKIGYLYLIGAFSLLVWKCRFVSLE